MIFDSQTRDDLVLIVDDDPTLRILVRATLEKAGFEVEEAGDGEAALEQLDRRRVIGLVLNDAEQGRAHYGYY